MSSSSFGSDSNNVLGLPSRRSLNQLPGNVLGRGAAGVMLLPFYFFRKSRHFFQNRDTSFKNWDTSFKNRDTLSFLFLSLPPRSMLKKKKKGASFNQPYSASVIFEVTLLPSLLFIYLYAVEYWRKTGTLWCSWEINRDRGQKTGTVIAKQRRLVPTRHWQHHPPSDCLPIKCGVTNK